MKNRIPFRAGLLLAGLALTGVALAGAHFVRGPDCDLNSDGSVDVSWKEAGLGDIASYNYVASADVSGLWQCVNRGGNCPAASNKQEFNATLTADGIFPAGKNGSISGTLTMEVPDSTLDCPGNQVVQLAYVNYVNISLEGAGGIAIGDPSHLEFSRAVCP